MSLALNDNLGKYGFGCSLGIRARGVLLTERFRNEYTVRLNQYEPMESRVRRFRVRRGVADI